jgi:hypothetical protein
MLSGRLCVNDTRPQPMVQEMAVQEDSASAGRSGPGGAVFGLAVGGAVLGAAVLLGVAVLWIRYGTAVFFEMVASGIAACI